MNPDHTHFPVLQPLWPTLKERGGKEGKEEDEEEEKPSPLSNSQWQWT